MLLTPEFLANAQSFQLDFDSLQTGVSELTGGDRIMEGGLTPQQAYGAANDRQIHPLGAPAYCGNGVKENGESCDGSDFGAATCQSHGFNQGTLACNASCGVSTSQCDDPITGSSSSSSFTATSTINNTSETTNGTQHGGGRRDVPIHTVPPHIEQTESPSQPSEQRVPQHNAPLQVIPDESPSSGVLVPEGEAAPILHEGAFPEAKLEERGQATGRISDTQSFPAAPRSESLAENLLTDTSPAAAYTYGGIVVTQAGILSRLGWIAHVKNFYAAVPAFESASVPFSGLLSGMRPGSVSISTLVPPFFFRKRRKCKDRSPETLSS